MNEHNCEFSVYWVHRRQNVIKITIDEAARMIVVKGEEPPKFCPCCGGVLNGRFIKADEVLVCTS